MIRQATLVYIITLGISVQFHIARQSHPLSPLLNAAVILFVLLLSRAFFQMFNQFVGRMRSDEELRELERRRVQEERKALARHAAAERRPQELREEDRRKDAHVTEQAMLELADRYEASVVRLAVPVGATHSGRESC